MRKINENLINEIINCIKENVFDLEEYLTIRKIATIINKPYQTVGYYMKRLKKDEVVIDDIEYGYNLKSIGDKYSMPHKNVHVLGDIPCGELDIANCSTEEYIKLPTNMISDGKYFVLKARGNSMIDAGIETGDYVLIKEAYEAEEGQVVVFLSTEFSDSGITLKRYYPETEKNRIRLHPENRNMNDIYVKTGRVQGIAKKVIKVRDIV